MSVTSDERHALANLFDVVGPDAPTLCGTWTTRDLVAHLILREGRPDAAAGIVIPALAERTERMRADVAVRPYGELVETFRGGAPLWSPLGWPIVGDQANLCEFFVHHEDVRRAQPDWEPRPEDTNRDDALWKSLRFGARILFRKSPVGVVLQSVGHGEIVARKGDPAVILVGLPGEITLVAFGRPNVAARIVVEGTPSAVEAFNASDRSM